MEAVNQGPEVLPLTPATAVQLGATSLTLYGKMFFPKAIRQQSPKFHDAIGQILYDPSARQVAFEVFRDGAKTTLLRVYLSQRIAYAISRTIMVVSASQGHSILTLRWLKRQVEFNKVWAQIFQLRKGAKWTDDYIEIWHGTDEVPITVIALGITGQVRGFNIDDYRPDLILCDDTSTDETSGSPEQRRKEQSTFFGALINSLAPRSEAPNAKIVVLDTPKNKFDLVETLLSDPAWRSVRFGILDENQQSRWETRYPTAEVLAAKQEYIRTGRLAVWMREKECKIIAEELSAFRMEHLLYWDVLPDRMTYVISIDPASSESKTADDNVVMVVGFWKQEIFLVDYVAEIGQTPEMVAKAVFEFYRRYRPTGIVVESIGYQRVLAWYLEKAMREHRMYMPVYQVQDRRKKSDRIIQAIGEKAALGALRCKQSQTKFLEQYVEYSPLAEMHDDVLDALAMAITWADEKSVGDWIEGEYAEVEDEEFQRKLSFRSAP